MEIKDVIYIVGLVLTFTISLFSLIINIKNRRNSIREHLYKEQMSLFIKLARGFQLLLDLYYDVSRDKILNDSKDIQLEQQVEEIYLLIDMHDFIVPNEIYSILNDTIKEGDTLHLKAMKGPITNEDIASFKNNYFNLVEEIREFLGVDKLSDENKNLFHRK